MSLFVLASKDGWVNIMYHGLDAVAVDQQVWSSNLIQKMFKCSFTSPSENFLLPVSPQARHQQQPVDAALLHLLPPHRQLLRAQHVRRRGGGELPQVPTAPGGGGGQAARGEASAADGEEEEE